MVNQQIDNKKIRQGYFLAFLTFLFIFLFLQMRSFLPGFLGAITFYMLLRGWMDYLVEKRKWKKSLAAGLLLLFSFLVVMVPVIITINLLSDRVGTAMQNSTQIVDAFNAFIRRIEQRFDVSIMSGANASTVSGTLANTVRGVANATFSTITSIAIMYFILYFMLVSKKEMEGWLHDFMPMREDNVDEMGKEFKSLVVSNALGIPLVAVLQGIVGLIAYLILGVNDIWFWFLLTCIASMLPFLGAALAYVPLCIVLYMGDEHWKALFLLIYGFGVVGTVDNVFRFMLQKKMGDVHPLITVFGVIIGINLFGFIGLIFGPILISMFILLIKIYLNEFSERRVPTPDQLME